MRRHGAALRMDQGGVMPPHSKGRIRHDMADCPDTNEPIGNLRSFRNVNTPIPILKEEFESIKVRGYFRHLRGLKISIVPHALQSGSAELSSDVFSCDRQTGSWCVATFQRVRS